MTIPERITAIGHHLLVDHVIRVYGDTGTAFQEAKEAIAHALLAAEQRGAAREIVVKPLEWMQHHTSTWYAESVVGAYGAWDGYYRPPGSYGGIASGSTIEEAKAAAQADYDARIRAAIMDAAPPAERERDQQISNILHDAEFIIADYLELRDEALGTPEADDDERAESAKQIISAIRNLFITTQDEPVEGEPPCA